MTNQKQASSAGRCAVAAVLSIGTALCWAPVSALSLQREVQRQPDNTAGPPATPADAVEAAAQNGDRETLLAILREGSPSEQVSAFDSLHAIDPDLAIAAVMADFRNPTLGSRVQSLYVIDQSAWIDDRTAASILREALPDADATVRSYALEALSRRGLLSQSDLAGPETPSQQLAKVRLAAIAHDQSTLRDLLRASDSVVQSAAFDGLEASGEASLAFSDLAVQFQDTATANRLQILELLTRTPTTDRRLLERLLQQGSDDQDALVKDFASRALAAMRWEDAQQPSAQ